MSTKFSDGVNFIGKQRPARLLNMTRVYSSFQTSKLSGKVDHAGMPVTISIEPTTSCNLRCPECPSGLRSFTRPTGMLGPDFFKSIVDQVHEKILYLTFYFQGEPFLHPDFPGMVKYATSKKIYTATSTNA